MPNPFRFVYKMCTDIQYRTLFLNSKNFYKNLTDEQLIIKLYKANLKETPDLENPTLFTEKLNWLKLYDHRPEYIRMADKYEVKQYVSEKLGPDYVLPALGVWEHFDDINFDALPDQFVLKCTHDSGGFVVCKDKSTFDKEAAKAKIEKCLSMNYFRYHREWVYKNIKPRIIAEPYLDSLGKPDSIEYKLTCCDGKMKMFTVCRGVAHDSLDVRTNDHYDREGNILPFYAFYKNSPVPVPMPPEKDEIIAAAEKLSEGIPQVRVDFYVHNGHVYFGEMTFYTWAGFIEFTPPEWNKTLGDWVTLPEKRI